MLTRVILLVAAAGAAFASSPRIDFVTYLGGSYAEHVAGVAVDAAGTVYVAGTTYSPDFPLTSTTLGAPGGQNPCGFVTKFNANGTGILMSVCLPNSMLDAFALDPAGNLYVSDGGSVVKLDGSGQNILYRTPVTGRVEAIAVDATGAVYLTGTAGPGLATTWGAYQPQLAPGDCPGKWFSAPCGDAFAMKLTPSGAVAWATYLGGAGPDDAHAVAVDAAGNVWLAGETVSANFPTTAGAVQTVFHGEVDVGPLRYGDAFVAKLDAAGSRLLYSTYLGGAAPDGALALAVDAAGAVYVGGGTQSADFPVTAGAFQQTYDSGSSSPTLYGNGFVTKLDSSGKLVYGTYLGGGGAVAVTALALDAQGQIYAGLPHLISTSTFVAVGCAAKTPPVLVLNPTGTALAASSPVGGKFLALDGKGGMYAAGDTGTLAFFSTPHAYQIAYGGGDSDAYAAKVDFTQPAGPGLSCLVNAASFLAGNPSPFPDGAVAPGEIVSLFGSGFGSQPTVTFGGWQAPVLYASDTQINAVVPFAAGPFVTFASVQSEGQTIGPVRLPVVQAVPALFTINRTGMGQAAIVNQDGTVNSAANPAPRGSVVSVYMTGAGAFAGGMQDGSLGPLTPPFPQPELGVSAAIGGVAAPVLFAGQAPGLIAGAVQVNLQVPDAAPSGASVPITVYAGNYASQFGAGVTMAVR